MRSLSSILEPPTPKSNTKTGGAATKPAAQLANDHSDHDSPEDSNSLPRIPIVRLDTDLVTDEMAASLAVSFLGHVLFLKNQVPFPVSQLARLPGANSTTRAAKYRTELLSSFDTLSSHLSTTFTALSTALARCARSSDDASTSRAYLAMFVGPSVGTAKARVIYAIDGLETKVWGQRDDSKRNEAHGAERDEGEDDDEDGEEPEDSDEESDDGEEEEEEESDKEGEEGDDDANGDGSDLPPPSPSPSPPPPYTSHAEQQHAIHLADRLLSRTLAGADPAPISLSELPPSHTHILIRAPRCFVHPAWAPRHNACATLEAALAEFLLDSGASPRAEDVQRKRRGTKQVEGVWVTSRHGLASGPEDPEAGDNDDDRDEDDEMIWWAWEGKIVGFSDW